MIPTFLAIFIDLKCNFRCAHCSVSSGPDLSMHMARAVMDKAIMEAKEVPTVKVVVFTGGEPTLFMTDLIHGIEKAHENGFITRVVTNAFWARTKGETERYISRLRDAGLDEINTSYDDYHAQFMDVKNVYRFVEASLHHDLRVAVASVTDNRSKISSASLRNGVAAYLGLSGSELGRQVLFLEDKPTPAGRGRGLARDKDRLPTYEKLTERIGCKELGKTLAVHPDGSVHLCCGHAAFDTDALSVGNILDESLPSLVKESHSNLLYWWIHMGGPNKILQAVGDSTKYATICDACLHVLTDQRERVVEYLRKNRSAVLLNDVLLSDDIVTVTKELEPHLGPLLKRQQQGGARPRLAQESDGGGGLRRTS
jgi:hypothetical protein